MLELEAMLGVGLPISARLDSQLDAGTFCCLWYSDPPPFHLSMSVYADLIHPRERANILRTEGSIQTGRPCLPIRQGATVSIVGRPAETF